MSGWESDHFYPILGPGPCREGWATPPALAPATRPLRLGELVTGIHHRHPAVLAGTAATVHILPDGRLEIGLGADWNEEGSGGYGLALGTPRRRSDRLEEACAVIVGLLTGETTTFRGRYDRLEEARRRASASPAKPPPPRPRRRSWARRGRSRRSCSLPGPLAEAPRSFGEAAPPYAPPHDAQRRVRAEPRAVGA